MATQTLLDLTTPSEKTVTPQGPKQSPREAVPCPRMILRFKASERRLHWSIAGPFLMCLFSAVVLLLVYNPHPLRPGRYVFSILHRVSGVCLIVLPLLTARRYWRDYRIHLYNIRTALTWVRDDVRWLFLMAVAVIKKDIPLPPQSKFNAAEKVNFLMVMCTYPIFITTGLLMWTHKFAFASWLLHLALVASAAPLVFGHIFMATINPSTRIGLSGMVTGYVDREWAHHHYTKWYEEHFGGSAPVDERPASAQADAIPELETAAEAP